MSNEDVAVFLFWALTGIIRDIECPVASCGGTGKRAIARAKDVAK